MCGGQGELKTIHWKNVHYHTEHVEISSYVGNATTSSRQKSCKLGICSMPQLPRNRKELQTGRTDMIDCCMQLLIWAILVNDVKT